MGKTASWMALMGLLPCWLLAAPMDELVNAARDGNIPAVEALLAAGVDVNGWGPGNICALHTAVGSDQPEMVKWLLAHGANPNKRYGRCFEPGCSAETPLGEASRVGSMKLVRMLLQSGAEIGAGMPNPTELANAYGHVEVFQFLQSIGGRVERPYTKVRRNSARDKTQRPSDLAAPGIETMVGKRLLSPAEASGRISGKRSRLAVINDARNADLGDLVFAALSQAPDLELVERTELHRIIAEQKLTLAFAADQANYGRLADLLKADALLLINNRKFGDKIVVEARLVRTNPGLILDTRYCPATLKEMNAWAPELAEGVRALSGRVATDKGIAVSVVNLRASVGSTAARDLEDALTLLLTERLVRMPGVHVLERSEMDRLVREQPIAGSGGFWTAAWMIDGTISPDLNGSGGLSVKLELRPAGGGKPVNVEVRGTTQAIAALREELAQRIMRTLANADAVSSPFPAGEEAARYLREARWALDCNLPQVAYRAAEAAWALGEQSAESAQVRVTSATTLLAYNHTNYSKISRPYGGYISGEFDPFQHPDRQADLPGAEEIFDLAMHALEIYRTELRRFGPQDKAALAEWLRLGDRVMKDTLSPALLANTATLKIGHAERLRAWRETWKDAMNALLACSEQVEDDAELHASRWLAKVHATQFWAASPEDTLGVYRDFLKQAPTVFRVASRLKIRFAIFQASKGGIWEINGPPNLDRVWQVSSYRLRQDFMRELQLSSAADDRLLGWMIQRAKDAPAAGWAGDTSESTIRHVMDCMWDLRREFAEDPKVLFEWMRNAGFTNVDLHGTADGQTTKKDLTPMWADFRKKLFISLCEESPGLLDINWAPDRKLLNDEDLAEESAALEVHFARESTRLAAEKTGRKFGSYQSSMRYWVLGSSTSRAVAPEGPSLEVKRFWRIPESAETLYFRAQRAVWSEDRAWFLCEDRSGNGVIFAVDLDTFQQTMIELPKGGPHADSWPTDGIHSRDYFMVTPQRILLIRTGEYFAVYDRATRQWQLFRDLTAAGLPIVIGDDCYFKIFTPDSTAVVRFNLPTQRMDFLANTRRQPTESPLDDASLAITGIANGPHDDLIVYFQTKQQAARTTVFDNPVDKYLWSPRTRQWEAQPRLRHYSDNWVAPGFFRIWPVSNTKHSNELQTPTGPTYFVNGPKRDVRLRFQLPPTEPNSEFLVGLQCPRGILLASGRGFGFVTLKELNEHLAKYFPNVSAEEALPPTINPQ